MTSEPFRAELLVDALKNRGLTLAVAESLTGGALTAAVVDVPGASAVLAGAVVAYATPIKASVLGVDPQLLDQRGAVDPEVASQMASGVRTALSVDGNAADVGVATTGVAGPASQSGQAVGTVYVAVSFGETTVKREFRLAGDRATIRSSAVDGALRFLTEVLDA